MCPQRSAQRLPNIDGLRFIASAAIMFLHSWPFYYPVAERAAVARASQGLGFFVDLFFVLSGFVIAHFYAGSVGTLAGFAAYMRRRVARLLPLHLATVALAVVAAATLQVWGVQMKNEIDLSPACVASTAALLHWAGGCVANPPNPQSWSVSAEMAMYLIFPLLLTLPGKALIGGVGLVGLVVAAPSVEDWMHLPGPLRALPSFILGLAAFEHREWLGKVRQRPLARCGPRRPFRRSRGGPGGLVVAAVVRRPGWRSRPTCRRLRRGPAIAPLGKFSYSIY